MACLAAACGGSKGGASPSPADGAVDRIATGPDTTVSDAAFDASVADAAPPVETGGTKRPFPDTSQKIAILADQLPDLTAEQQQFADGSKRWMAQGFFHPFVQLEPTPGESPGDALLAAYTAWKQQNP